MAGKTLFHFRGDFHCPIEATGLAAVWHYYGSINKIQGRQ